MLGGVFAEGVDYPGEMLSEVIVVSPALPQVGPERELLKGTTRSATSAASSTPTSSPA